MLKPIDDPSATSWRDFSLTKFWVQIHNIPLYAMIGKIDEMLGDQIGTYLEVEKDHKGRCVERYTRIRVLNLYGGGLEYVWDPVRISKRDYQSSVLCAAR